RPIGRGDGPLSDAASAEAFLKTRTRPRFRTPRAVRRRPSSFASPSPGGAQKMRRRTKKNWEERVMRQTGKVKFFNEAKGYGFITPNEGCKGVFGHISAVQESGLAALAEGQLVSFETEPDRRGKGPKAVNLQAG